jgi:hypothetical protein
VHLTFLQYWALMMLPTLVSVGVTLLMLFVVFVWRPTRGNAMQRRFTPLAGSGSVLRGTSLPINVVAFKGVEILEVQTSHILIAYVLSPYPPWADLSGVCDTVLLVRRCLHRGTSLWGRWSWRCGGCPRWRAARPRCSRGVTRNARHGR